MANLAYAEDGTNSTAPDPQLPPPDPEIETNSTILDNVNATSLNKGNYIDPDVITELLAQAEESRNILIAALTATYGGNSSLIMAVTNDTMQQSLGPMVPASILNSQMHGDDAVNKTGQLLEQANANAAAQQVMQAMKHYRNALRKAYKDNPEALEGLEESGNETDPILPLTGEPVNQTEILDAKMTLIQQFQENFQKRVMSMEETVNSMMNELSDKDSQKAADALERTERKLLRIQERLNRGEIDEAIDDLENATDGLDEDLSSFEDDHIGQMLRTMNKMEARVQRMVDIMNRKAANGNNLSGDEDAINEAWGQLKKFQEDFVAGNSSSAPGKNKDENNGNGHTSGNGNGNGNGKDK
jgi:tetratricopeptide (TPR) repeat protein